MVSFFDSKILVFKELTFGLYAILRLFSLSLKIISLRTGKTSGDFLIIEKPSGVIFYNPYLYPIPLSTL